MSTPATDSENARDTDRPTRATESTESTAPQPTDRARWWSRARIGAFIESSRMQGFIIGVIIVNAAVLGFETSRPVMAQYADLLSLIDQICLIIFVIELGLKLYAFRIAFFKNSWNVFDLLVVGIALVPDSGAFGVLRSLRVLRVLRLISTVPQLRRVVDALVRAVPGILSIGALLVLIFYVSGVMATMLFRDDYPEYFGSLGGSLFTLLQVTTFDDWGNISRTLIEHYPWALAFMIPFILLSAFTVLNLFIAVIVDAMGDLHDEEDAARASAQRDEPGTTSASGTALATEVRELRSQIAELTELVKQRS